MWPREADLEGPELSSVKPCPCQALFKSILSEASDLIKAFPLHEHVPQIRI